MKDFWLSILVIFVLFFFGAVFAAAEMALVTLREGQIKKLIYKGRRGEAIAKLTSNPNLFLSAVQIGVTLAGFLSSAYGSDSLANQYLAPWLAAMGVPAANVVAIVIVTALISFFSIVFSELTAKRLAMQRPEQFALALAPLIYAVAVLARPVIWLLGKCTNIVVRILGGDPETAKETVSEEEIRSMVASSQTLGDEERAIMDDVFDAGERSLREVMVPRTEVDFISSDQPCRDVIRFVQDQQHSRYPVAEETPDQIIGFVHVRDLMGLTDEQLNQPISSLVRPVLSLPETVKILPALTLMRRHNSHLTMVVDEYGGTAGIITLEDLVEELIGDITDEYDVVDEEHAQHMQLRDVEGLTSLEDFADLSHLVLPEGPYDTVAGFVMAELGRLPQVGDYVSAQLPDVNDLSDEPQLHPVRFTVREMDGRRIAWVAVRAETQDGEVTSEPPKILDENYEVFRQTAETDNLLAKSQHEDDLSKPGI